MYPLYKEGDSLLTFKCFRKASLIIGQIYVYKVPCDKGHWVVKRLTSINENGNYYFVGDNRIDSYDSRHYGHVSPKQVVSKVICKF